MRAWVSVSLRQPGFLFFLLLEWNSGPYACQAGTCATELHSQLQPEFHSKTLIKNKKKLPGVQAERKGKGGLGGYFYSSETILYNTAVANTSHDTPAKIHRMYI